METYREKIQNLSAYKSKNQFRLFIFSGLGYILLGFINYFINEHIYSGVLWFLSGVGFLVAAFRQKVEGEKYFIEFNKDGIIAKIEIFYSLEIKWDEIEKIHIKPISISFLLKNKEEKELSLGSLSYKSVITIKDKLNDFAEEKGITCS
jgi:uncharacterized membrane protein YbhN (UPF0104 family)